MKKNSTQASLLTDEEIDVLTRHQRFINISTKDGRYRYKKIERLTGEFDSAGIKLLERTQEKVLDKKLSFCPEYVAYTMALEGCPRQLLDYLLFYEVRQQDGKYRFNKQTIARFQTFTDSLGPKQYTESTIKKAHRTLVDRNLALNVNHGLYMMNPMVYDPGSQDLRRQRINEYSRCLIDSGKNTTLQFLPRVSA